MELFGCEPRLPNTTCTGHPLPLPLESERRHLAARRNHVIAPRTDPRDAGRLDRDILYSISQCQIQPLIARQDPENRQMFISISFIFFTIELPKLRHE